MNGETGSFIGRMPMFNERIMAVALPLKEQGGIIGVLRYSVSAEPLHAAVFKIALHAAAIGLLIIFLGFGLSLIIARRIVDPLAEVTRIARQMAGGNFAVRTVKQFEDEVGTLADTLNYMAEEMEKNENSLNRY